MLFSDLIDIMHALSFDQNEISLILCYDELSIVYDPLCTGFIKNWMTSSSFVMDLIAFST